MQADTPDIFEPYSILYVHSLLIFCAHLPSIVIKISNGLELQHPIEKADLLPVHSKYKPFQARLKSHLSAFEGELKRDPASQIDHRCLSSRRHLNVDDWLRDKHHENGRESVIVSASCSVGDIDTLYSRSCSSKYVCPRACPLRQED